MPHPSVCPPHRQPQRRAQRRCQRQPCARTRARTQGSELIRRAPEGFAVLSGDDDLTFALMATGAKGVVSVASNIAPAEVAAMADALLRDDIPAARALHHRLSPLFKACFLESSPVPAKAAMAQLGLMTDAVRLPLAPASDATRAALASVLSDLF